MHLCFILCMTILTVTLASVGSVIATTTLLAPEDAHVSWFLCLTGRPSGGSDSVAYGWIGGQQITTVASFFSTPLRIHGMLTLALPTATINTGQSVAVYVPANLPIERGAPLLVQAYCDNAAAAATFVATFFFRPRQLLQPGSGWADQSMVLL